MAQRNYSNTAVETALSSGITAGATSLSVLDATGWPSPPFILVVDPDTADEELILVDNKTGTTFSSLTRGFGGTSAVAHSGSAVVKHVAVAEDYVLIWDHVHSGSGGDDSAKVSHDDLNGVSSDDHHDQVHALDGPDHTGDLPSHGSDHLITGGDSIPLGDLDARARVVGRVNGAGNFARRALNFITGNGVDVSIADDPTNEELDITIGVNEGEIDESSLDHDSLGGLPGTDPHTQYVHKSGFTAKGTLIGASAASTVETVPPPADAGSQSGDDKALVYAEGETPGMKWLALVPPGTVTPYAGTGDPAGWFLCDGRELSRTVYQRLFDQIGTTFGVGDGSTTFNIPDLRGVFPVGAGAGAEYDLGDTGGEETHALTEAEMPTHSHTMPSHSHGAGSLAADSDAHDHDITSQSTGQVDHTHEGGVGTASQAITGGGGSGTGAVESDSHSHGVSGSTQSVDPGDTNNAGSGTAHENRPPFLALNFIIKT